MNTSLNLKEMLNDCPVGTPLYSTLHGNVELKRIEPDSDYPIIVDSISDNGDTEECSFTNGGKFYYNYQNSEVTLFPSCENRDWATFKPKKIKFDPKTLKPFDKVLVRNAKSAKWSIDFFGYIDRDRCAICAGMGDWENYIPYNDETKHLVGTTEEAPEFYRYWEE